MYGETPNSNTPLFLPTYAVYPTYYEYQFNNFFLINLNLSPCNGFVKKSAIIST